MLISRLRKIVTFVLVLATPARLSRWHALYGLLLHACLAASALHTTTMAPGTPSVAGYTHVLIVSDCWWSGPYQTQLAADPVVATRASWEVVAMESLVGGECILAVLRACMLQSRPHTRWSTCSKQDASHSHVKPTPPCQAIAKGGVECDK